MNRDGHGAWVNSRALALAGIDRASPDPASGRIEREPDGDPSGTLHEGAMEIVRRILPPDDDRGAWPTACELAQAYLHRLGITAWQDAWVTAADLAAYRLIAERGLLTGRAIACHWWERDLGGEQIDELIERRRTGTIGRLRSTTVKIMTDGVAENYTAAMLEPYLDGDGRPTANRGISFVDPELLKQLRHPARRGSASRSTSTPWATARSARRSTRSRRPGAANGPSDGRHHLAHLQVVDPADYPRFAAARRRRPTSSPTGPAMIPRWSS